MDGATSNHGHGWCKDLKSILSPLARSAGFPGCGFTGLSSPVDQERATGKSPEPAGSKACATNPPRFMVPMRATYGVEATHEPERRAPARRGVACPERADLEIGAPSPGFMVPMRAQWQIGALH